MNPLLCDLLVVLGLFVLGAFGYWWVNVYTPKKLTKDARVETEDLMMISRPKPTILDD